MMKHARTIAAAGGLALAFVTVTGIGIGRAEADDGIASNAQLKGRYTGTSSGGCLASLAGFDANDQPKDQTKTFSTLVTSESVYTFDGNGRGKAEFDSASIYVPGPNPITPPRVSLTAGGGNFKYAVGPKNTVTITLTDLVFKNLNGAAAGQNSMVDKFVLEGHFPPHGITLTETDGGVEMAISPTGAAVPRTCVRSSVLLRDHLRN
jgi:hypothetical protein